MKEAFKHRPVVAPVSADAPTLGSAFHSRFVVGFLVFFAVAAAALGNAGPAAAAAEDPELLIQQGIQLRLEKDNEAALRVFTRAYELAKTPRAAAHLGTCEYSLLRLIDAETHLEEALRSRSDPWIERNRREIQGALEGVKSELGWLEVLGRPAGAEVEVAGRTVGRLPLRQQVRLAAGEVYVRVSADGYEPYRRGVVITPRLSARVVVDLDRIESGGQVVSRGATAADSDAPKGPPPPIDVRTSSAGSNSWRWPAAWVGAGLATVFVAGGIWGTLAHASKVDEFDNIKKPGTTMFMCSTSSTDSGGGRCPGLLAEANLARTIGIVSFVGAGAAAVVSTVLFATAPSASERLALTRCLPQVGATGAGATCGWRF